LIVKDTDEHLSLFNEFINQSINQLIKSFILFSWHKTNRFKCVLEIENQKEQREKIKPFKDLDPAIRVTLYTEK